MPDDAPAGKLAATRGYGAEVIGFDRYASDREQLLAELVAERGLVPVHPYDDARVMAGQGTVATRAARPGRPARPAARLRRRRRADRGLRDRRGRARAAARVIGVEPEAGDDTRRSLAAGERVRIAVPRTIADGQQLADPGRADVRGRPPARRPEIAVASDAEIVAAMRFLFERLKTVAEPSGACALAALLAGRVERRGCGSA